MVDERQPGKVGPPAHRVELRGIPLQRRRADQSRVGLLRQQLGLAPDPPAVERRRDLAEVRGRVVPVRRRQRQHRARPAGETPEPRDPGRRGGEHEPADAIRELAHQLLRERTAEGDAEHVDRLVAERADEVVDGARKAAHATRATPARRLPDTWRVEGDRLDAGAVERPLERLPHLDVAADAHDEQQRLPLAADGGPNAYPVDIDEVDAPGHPPLSCSSRHTVRGRHPPRACSVAPMESTDPPGSYLTPSFEHARVADAMRPRVLTCDPETPLVTVAQRMASEHVHAIVVLLETADARWRAVPPSVEDRHRPRCPAQRGLHLANGPRARSRRARSSSPSPTRTCPTSRTA